MAESGRSNRPNTKVIAQRVIELLEADLVAGGYDLLDVRVFQGGGRFQIRIFVDLLDKEAIDEATGVTMGQVTKAARTAGMLLEEADLFAGEYVIEVSSPGIRRPLRKQEHYVQAIGKKIDLRVAGSTRVRGVLEAVEGKELVLKVSATSEDAAGEEVTADETVRVNVDKVLEANLDPDFDAQAIINADRRRRKDAKREGRQERAANKKKKGRPKNRPKNDSPDSRPDEDGGST